MFALMDVCTLVGALVLARQAYAFASFLTTVLMRGGVKVRELACISARQDRLVARPAASLLSACQRVGEHTLGVSAITDGCILGICLLD